MFVACTCTSGVRKRRSEKTDGWMGWRKHAGLGGLRCTLPIRTPVAL